MEQRNRILLVMAIAIGLGYMPWYNFSAVLKYLIGEFDLTSSDTGYILAAFQAGYVVIVPLTAWLGDRFGPGRVMSSAMLVTGLSSIVFVLINLGKMGIVALRMITGLAAGATYVPGMALLSRWFGPSQRGSALGIYTGALVAAYAGGYFVAGPVSAAYGWRAGILATSLPAFLGAFLVHAYVPACIPDAGREVDACSVSASGVRVAGRSREGYAGPILVTLAYMGHMWEQYAFWGWLGPFMMSVAARSGRCNAAAVRWGGLTASLIVLLGVPSSSAWGFVADRFGATSAIAIASCFSIVGEILLSLFSQAGTWVVVLIAGWIGFWVVADSALYKAVLTCMVDDTMCATYLGVQSALGYAVTIVSPIVFGRILGHFSGNAELTDVYVWGPSFLSLGIGALVSPLAMCLLSVYRLKEDTDARKK